MRKGFPIISAYPSAKITNPEISAAVLQDGPDLRRIHALVHIQVFYVNGTRNRNAHPVDAKIHVDQGVLKLQFEGDTFLIRIPY